MREKMISVIIPAHNEEKYIAGCIRSILGQPYKDYEIIVVCNGCTDRTAIAARKTRNFAGEKAAKIRVIESHKANVSAARNIGAKNAKGDVFVFLDADSLVAKNLLERIAYYAAKGYAGGTAKTTSIEEGLIPRSAWLIGNTSKHFFLTASGMMFCTRAAFSRFNEERRIGEDTYFLLELKKKGKVKFIRESHIKTSSRRFEKEGYVRTTLKMCMGFFLKKNFKYEAVR
jgi:glycosyltransferase involved in cell wall biosynthesis